MSDESQNSISTENSIPASLQEPIEPATENTSISDPVEAPSKALESLPSDFSVKSNDIPLPDSTLIEPEKEPETEEKPRENEPAPEPISELIPVSEPVQAIEPSDSISPSQATAQIPVNEPLTPETEIKIEPNIQEVKSEPVSVSNSNTVNEIKPEPEPEKINSVPVIVPNKNKILELLVKAKNAIQFRKRKKLDKIMTLFLKKSKITNDEVEKFLHISDATATRYLSQLKKENKIKQVGKTGHSVFYQKII